MLTAGHRASRYSGIVEVEVVMVDEKIERCSQQDIELHVTQVLWRWR